MGWMLPATIAWQRYRAAIDSANTPYCQSPVNTLAPVRTGDGQIFSEASQQAHRHRRSRRMVGDSLHISIEPPLRPLFTNSGRQTDYCRELGPKKPGVVSRTGRPNSEPLPLLSALGGRGLPLLKAEIVAEEKVPQLSDGRFRVRE